MAPKTTYTTREFLRNFAQMKEGQMAIIKNRNKKKWVLIPYENLIKEKKNNRKVSIKELAPFFVKGGQKNISEKVDNIYL